MPAILAALIFAVLLILVAIFIALYPYPFPDPSALRLLRKAPPRRTPLEIVQASERAKQRERPQRPLRPPQLPSAHAHAKPQPPPARRPPPPPITTTTTTTPTPTPTAHTDTQHIPRKKHNDRRRPKQQQQPQAPLHTPPPSPPPRVTQTYSIELDPTLLSFIHRPGRRAGSRSTPSRPRPEASSRPHPSASAASSSSSSNINRSNTLPHKRTSSHPLDPSAPCFTPSAHASSLSLSLTLSISPALSPSLSISPLSLSPPSSPATEPYMGEYAFPVAVPSTPKIRASAPGEAKVFRRQPYDAYLVLDVEATCIDGGGFDYPNEIIEWPVVLMRWAERDSSGRVATLVPVAEFRSFVRPTWAPTLSQFCTDLTGITQAQIDPSPPFPTLLTRLLSFLVAHSLVDPLTEEPLIPYTFATDGPWDMRDFLAKQCWLSGVAVPRWLGAGVVDSRAVLRQELGLGLAGAAAAQEKRGGLLQLPRQLALLGLAPFEGRQHSGIDDTRNIARILAELARRGAVLAQNQPIHTGQQWPWMGAEPGQVSWPAWGGEGHLDAEEEEEEDWSVPEVEYDSGAVAAAA